MVDMPPAAASISIFIYVIEAGNLVHRICASSHSKPIHPIPSFSSPFLSSLPIISPPHHRLSYHPPELLVIYSGLLIHEASCLWDVGWCGTPGETHLENVKLHSETQEVGIKSKSLKQWGTAALRTTLLCCLMWFQQMFTLDIANANFFRREICFAIQLFLTFSLWAGFECNIYWSIALN